MRSWWYIAITRDKADGCTFKVIEGPYKNLSSSYVPVCVGKGLPKSSTPESRILFLHKLVYVIHLDCTFDIIGHPFKKLMHIFFIYEYR